MNNLSGGITSKGKLNGSLAIGKIGSISECKKNVYVGESPEEYTEVWFDPSEEGIIDEVATKKFVEERTVKLETSLDNIENEIDSLKNGNIDVNLIDYATKEEMNYIKNDMLGGKSFKYLTQGEYEILSETEKNNDSVVYVITDKSEPVFSLSLNGSVLNLIKDGEVVSSVMLPTSSDGDVTIYGNLVVSTTSLSVNESATATFTVKLDQAPTNSQTINISVNNAYCTLDKTSLTFTSDNYSTAQTVTVTGVKDSSSYSNKTSTITISSTNVIQKTIAVTIVNTDSEPTIPDEPTTPEFTNYIYNSDTFVNPTTGNASMKTQYYYVPTGITGTVEDKVWKLTLTENGAIRNIQIKHAFADNKIYYVQYKVKSTYDCNAGNSSKLEGVSASSEWTTISYVYTDSVTSAAAKVTFEANVPVGNVIEIKEPMKICLTDIYGTGNEPTKEVCDATFTTYKSGLVG